MCDIAPNVGCWLLLTLKLVFRFSSPSWCRRYVPPKRRFLQESRGVTSQTTAFFIVTAVKNPKCYIPLTAWVLQRRGNVSPVRYEVEGNSNGCCRVKKIAGRRSFRELNCRTSSIFWLGSMLSKYNPIALLPSCAGYALQLWRCRRALSPIIFHQIRPFCDSEVWRAV
jgi:hypothetical protein